MSKSKATTAAAAMVSTASKTTGRITKWFLLVVVPALVACALSAVLSHQQQCEAHADNSTSHCGASPRFVPEWVSSSSNVAAYLTSFDYLAVLQRVVTSVFWSSRAAILAWVLNALVILRICFVLLRRAQDRRAEHPKLSFSRSARNAHIARALASKTTSGDASKDSIPSEVVGKHQVIDARKYAANVVTNGTAQSFLFSALPGPLNSNFFSAMRGDDIVFTPVPMFVPEDLGGGMFIYEWVNSKLPPSPSATPQADNNNNNNLLAPIAQDAPIVILLPGVVGSSRDPYLCRVARHFLANGYRVGGKNWRGFAQGQTELGGSRPETWDSQTILDMHVCIQEVRKEFPQTKGVYALGFSTGGIVVCTYLGMNGAQDKSAKDVAKMWPMCDDPAMGLKQIDLAPLSGGISISGLVDPSVALEDLEDPSRIVPYSTGLSLLSCTAALNFQSELKTFKEVTARIRDMKEAAQLAAHDKTAKELPRLLNALLPVWNTFLRTRDVVKACIPATIRAQLSRLHPIASMHQGMDAMLAPFKFMQEHGITSIVHYHNVITCAHADFVDEADYRRHMRDVHTTFLKHTKNPLLCIVARDDPLFTPSTVDKVRHSIESSSGGFILESQTGGHCGFFHGLSLKPYADMMSLSFVDACEETQASE
jgi:predicted alpha/beta-fold hydrolase